MKLVYGKTLNADETLTVQNIANGCDILFDTARLLFYRGIDSVSKAKRFLSTGKSGFYSPFLLSGVKDAVERITLAKERGENVLIFGDYDADGVCATTVLYYCLTEFGVKNLRIYVPEREEGYGLNVDTVTRFNEQSPIDLLITVDCGISDCEKIKIIKDLGVDVIVTDHHEPPEQPHCEPSESERCIQYRQQREPSLHGNTSFHDDPGDQREPSLHGNASFHNVQGDQRFPSLHGNASIHNVQGDQCEPSLHGNASFHNDQGDQRFPSCGHNHPSFHPRAWQPPGHNHPYFHLRACQQCGREKSIYGRLIHSSDLIKTGILKGIPVFSFYIFIEKLFEFFAVP